MPLLKIKRISALDMPNCEGSATTLLRSQSYLGAQFRRFRARMGMPKAITAMAHKLARLIYRMLRYGQEYVVRSMEQYELKYRETQVRILHQKAKELGFQVIETKGAA